MKVLILPDAEAAVQRAADFIGRCVRSRADAVLGLATGATMLPVYDVLARRHRDEGLSFAATTSFNLDEYIGLAPDHPCSYHRYMQDAFFQHVDINPARTHLPKGDAADPQAASQNYEALIAAAGGIDLQILGIGENGHIGFNEPTASLGSRTRVKTLTESTRRANQRYFASFDDTPRFAITTGVATILESRHCLLLATGGSKADAVAGMVEGPVTAMCPASALQLHAHATVILDRDSAARLTLLEYYETVHPGGRDSTFE
ncbi:glucosamine-6-phosphate deaminase [Oceaniovalibus sp. ACAM 378]|uniref:glucosamine-6-phosphate deaminase n=1 Tax=Oceaniovalibus sp. ACAM 378 TaxID=2599923 RepID=UPI0011D96874|nr:glucosamine-6-phosphate deaminase [Oceaniovalibus sp. ACAM 378]TYB87930.1 glucosamine-6-phosphate deaminase [Oceaniovalibus sp. ACAM 378]